ncbi:4-aminobutyrate--2-oxoglutarate transaminase [Paenalcaligenes niemegkensis]|uniref:4-aminobutyrate--2-oxoglutarate transaminase n=1 Tax=Paenalcaligenes niemegkensis TaxID=2895469 RepID=UPI001EE85943|nr:4-aminobutyrate--2-oxoglutarate transaminase [Paenalcaligenes niemegkensis]MCQ9618141.1 4-aminobutyrate--2-oxoglutarate transaminase [Paenalcaligenes niemegkensis]
MSNANLKQRKDAATPRGVGIMCNFYADRADNAQLWDVEGKRYIDFAAGIAVLNTGHRHPRLIKAIEEQLQRFTHTAYQIVPYESYVELAEKINQLVPGPGDKKTAFFTTGAEAVENAIKIARSYTGRPSVVAFNASFHGRTLLGMALTGKVNPYKVGFGPFPSDVYHTAYPNEQAGVSVEDAKRALKALFTSALDPKNVAAIILEPVQGEGGFNVCPPEFMKHLREVCDEHGILLVADEVQTGFGRTGKLFAMEHYDVHADLTTMAKSLAGGMPLSGVCGRAEIMDAPAPGGLGGTYAGNPLAVASALAVIDVIKDEDLLARGNELGKRLQERLKAIAKDVKNIADIRGLGAMIAAEFKDPDTGMADPSFVKTVQERALEQGLLLLSCGTEANVIRFLFPLTITDKIMDEALDIIEEALRG